jgi:hypothetical protein
MQTRTYVSALDRIVELLRLNDLASLLTQLRSGPNRQLTPEEKASFGDLLFAMDSGFTAVMADPVLSVVAKGLDLELLLNRAARTTLMTTFHSSGTSNEVSTKQLFAQLFVSARTILRLRDGVRDLLVGGEAAAEASDLDHLDLEIEDYDGKGIPVRRVITALTALLSLYDEIERHQNGKTATPILKWVDSGSNIAFSLEGLAPVIGELRKTFAGAWQAVRFAKNHKMERDLETALKQMTLVRELDAQVAAGGPAGGEAARVRHAVMDSMAQLLGAGVLPTQLEDQSTYDRREVLAAVRDTKLLGPGEIANENRPDGASEA